jgi:putative membrane protein
MGLANLVPGISGGTMLLATGVYPAFIEAIADVTTLRLRLRSLVLLGCVAGAAALAILLLAGPTKALVLERRFVMYSLFIGLTLGGLPLVWRMARPLTPGVVGGALGGLALMILMVLAPGAERTSGGASTLLLFLSGLAGAGAMILPGVSGGYLLLLLGQYVVILSAIDGLRGGLVAITADGASLGALTPSLEVIVPVGLGVVTGIVGVSNLLRWLLHRFEKPTLGALLGLLLGAVIGLWPFQAGTPQPGLAAEEWPVEFFRPSVLQAFGSLALIALGLGLTLAIDSIGGNDAEAQE